MIRPIAFASHRDCGRHDTGWQHPEHQGRLPALVRALEAATPALLAHVLPVEATPADEAAIRSVHTDAHVQRVRDAVRLAEQRSQHVALDLDTIVSDASWDAAIASAGCALTATRLVLNEEAVHAFAACRPPGHHATADRAMGFCLFNNVAIAARDAQRAGAERVLIVDWDVHHGNGTQQIFYEDPSVFYLSLHLSPHYPGSGGEVERGAGAGAGTTLNVPLARGTDGEVFLARFDAALEVATRSFHPDLVLASAGFDCLAGDPLGGFRLEPTDLHALTRRLCQVADVHAAGRLVVVLEGGYAPDALGVGAVQVMRALADLPTQDVDGGS